MTNNFTFMDTSGRQLFDFDEYVYNYNAVTRQFTIKTVLLVNYRIVYRTNNYVFSELIVECRQRSFIINKLFIVHIILSVRVLVMTSFIFRRIIKYY